MPDFSSTSFFSNIIDRQYLAYANEQAVESAVCSYQDPLYDVAIKVCCSETILILEWAKLCLAVDHFHNQMM